MLFPFVISLCLATCRFVRACIYQVNLDRGTEQKVLSRTITKFASENTGKHEKTELCANDLCIYSSRKFSCHSQFTTLFQASDMAYSLCTTRKKVYVATRGGRNVQSLTLVVKTFLTQSRAEHAF
ncbi:hypothetical protein EI94DRAFT_761361 [Lactarius quietus]|nr:hypothetical protein EI94DRAFT_761361 [Lactarius quietus]